MGKIVKSKVVEKNVVVEVPQNILTTILHGRTYTTQRVRKKVPYEVIDFE